MVQGNWYFPGKAAGNINLYLPKTIAEIKTTGQDLYVFESYVPQELPKDGMVWIINPTSAIPGLNLNIGNPVVGNYRFESTSNNREASSIIMNHVTPSTIEVTKYTKVTGYDGFDVLMNNGKDADLHFRRMDDGMMIYFDVIKP